MPHPFNDAHALSGAYAVDALDPDERTRFEQHLRGCAECRAEVDSLREAAATLAVDSETAPPPALRDSVLAAIDTVRPLPPLHDADTPTPTAAPAIPLTRRLPRLPFLLAAAAVVLIAIVAAAQWRPGNDEDPKPELTATERVLSDLDAKRTRLDLPDAKVTLVVSRKEGEAVLLAEGMEPAPKGSDYQVWLQRPDGEVQSVGLMPDDEDAAVLLDGNAARATWVGITVEPDGGSKQPTTDPIGSAELSRS